MPNSENARTSPIREKYSRRVGFRLGSFLVRSVQIASVVLALTGAARGHSQPASPQIEVLPRMEEHDGLSRITFPSTTRGIYDFRRDGDKLVIVRPQHVGIRDLSQLPRNILQMSSDGAATVLTMQAGTRTRIDRVRGSLVVSVYAPATPGPQPPGPADAGLTTSKPIGPGPEPAKPAPPPITEPEPIARNDAPLSQPAVLTSPKPNFLQIQVVPDTAQPAILLPGTRDAAAAAFQLRDEAVVVLDKPFDFQPPPASPPFDNLASQRIEDATVIRIRLQNPGLVRIDRSPQGWIVTAGARREAVSDVIPLPVETTPDAVSVRFGVSEPGRVVPVIDPASGALLLIGTQSAMGQAVLEAREDSQYRLLPTVQGVVVSPISKNVSLHRTDLGFVLRAAPSGSAMAAAPASAPVRSRLFDLPRQSATALLDRLHEEFRAASEAPPLARTELRLKVGATMIALGLGTEAQSVLDIAVADDPSLLDVPSAIGLRAAAAILADRLDAAATMTDPRLAETDDGKLWRSLLAVAKGQVSAEDAKTLAAEMPVLLSYPPALRDRLLPGTLEAMAMNGQAAAASDVLAVVPGTPELDLARGITFEMLGQSAKALEQYDLISGRKDRKAAYRASIRAIELRIKAGTLDSRTGADALDRNLFGWREASREIALRLRIASLRRQSGQWREALAVLTDGIAAHPQRRAELDNELAQTLLALFAGDAAKSLSPADLVALYDKNIETVQSMSWPEQTGLKLADCLIGLGLPARAEPVLAKMAAQATDPARRPFLGARLADLRLDMNDPAGAIAALAATTPAPGLTVDASVIHGRQMLYAQAEARRGNTDAALAMFEAIGTAETDSARADIYVARKDWAHAVSALSALEQKRVPQSGSLTQEQQAIVARLAVAAALGEDDATLKRVTDTYGAAMASTASAGLFRILASNPVRNTADLPRAYEEIELARKVTAQYEVHTPP